MTYTIIIITTIILFFGGLIFLLATLGVFYDGTIRKGIWVIALCFWIFICTFLVFKIFYWDKTITITKDNQTNKIVYDGNYSISSDDNSFTIAYYKDGRYYEDFYGEGYNCVVEMK